MAEHCLSLEKYRVRDQRSAYVLKNRVQLADGVDDIPRVGLSLTLPAAFSDVDMYALGPHENYPDRLKSARLGRWQGKVDDFYQPYIVPQEHGARCGMRMIALRNEQGHGLMFCAPEAFIGTVSRFTANELFAARHPTELPQQAPIQLTPPSRHRPPIDRSSCLWITHSGAWEPAHVALIRWSAIA